MHFAIPVLGLLVDNDVPTLRRLQRFVWSRLRRISLANPKANDMHHLRLKVDPDEQNNLIHDPAFAKVRDEMQGRLYEMMEGLGGMAIPLNPPKGKRKPERLRGRNGVESADFPEAFIVDEPLREKLK